MACSELSFDVVHLIGAVPTRDDAQPARQPKTENSFDEVDVTGGNDEHDRTARRAPPLVTHDRPARPQRLQFRYVVRGRKGVPAANGCRARRDEVAVTLGWLSDSALVVNADRPVPPDPGHSHLARDDVVIRSVIPRYASGIEPNQPDRVARPPARWVNHQTVDTREIKPFPVVAQHIAPRRRHPVTRPDHQILCRHSSILTPPASERHRDCRRGECEGRH
jgi:hypothetical protein